MFQLIILFVYLSGCFGNDGNQVIKNEWEIYQKKFNKTYGPQEYHQRYVQFIENYLMIQRHNERFDQGLETFTMGIGPFADLSEIEFMKRFKSRFPLHRDRKTFIVGEGIRNGTVSTPTEVDYRRYMQPVKDQRGCNAGWSFATVAAVEGMVAKKLGFYPSLSEQNVIDCAFDKNHHRYGCNGGSILGSLFYIKSHGVATSQYYSYLGISSMCKESSQPALKIDSIFEIKGSESNLKYAVGNFGPVATEMQVTPTIMHYKSGIVFDKKCKKEAANHAVAVVGYGMEKFYHYWLLKNSWGENWGEEGYIKMARNYEYHCHIGIRAYYPDIKLQERRFETSEP